MQRPQVKSGKKPGLPFLCFVGLHMWTKWSEVWPDDSLDGWFQERHCIGCEKVAQRKVRHN